MSAVIETSAGVVVYRDVLAGREYLLLLSAHGPWEFPKGKLEPGETTLQAALRELREEAGLGHVNVVPGFTRQITYHFRCRGGHHRGRLVHKTVHYVLAHCPGRPQVRLSREHRQFAFLPFAAAVKRLSHAGPRAVLRDAVAFLDGARSEPGGCGAGPPTADGNGTRGGAVGH
jgi:8-oxo-dGTP pyrophosphatase MutT (NUDIX family)